MRELKASDLRPLSSATLAQLVGQVDPKPEDLAPSMFPTEHRGPAWVDALNGAYTRWRVIPMDGPGGALPPDYRCYRARTGSWDGSVRGWSVITAYYPQSPATEVTLGSYAIGAGGDDSQTNGDMFIVNLHRGCDVTEDEAIRAEQVDRCAFFVEELDISMRSCRLGRRQMWDPTIRPPDEIWQEMRRE